MSYNEDFDYDPSLSIVHVADLVRIDYSQEGIRFTSVCPFCGAKKGHFYLTPHAENYHNVYKCHSCGASGNQYDLYAHAKGFWGQPEYRKRAFKELKGFAVASKTIEYIRKAEEAIKKQYDILPIQTRDKVYRALSRKLSLSEIHTKNLFERGYNNTNIKESFYNTLPSDKGLKIRICKELIRDGLSLAGIPGFHTDWYNNWTFWTPKEGGFLVPYQDPLGKIKAFQVRKNGDTKKKYPWWSSSYMQNGAACTGFVHVHWNKAHSCKKVVITEGALKGSIASILSDTTFVCVPGVNTINDLIPTLKLMESLSGKIEQVWTAYDMDKFENPQVLKQEEKLISLLRSNNYDPKISDWSKSYFRNKKLKGIDDYLYNVRKIVRLQKLKASVSTL